MCFETVFDDDVICRVWARIYLSTARRRRSRNATTRIRVYGVVVVGLPRRVCASMAAPQSGCHGAGARLWRRRSRVATARVRVYGGASVGLPRRVFASMAAPQSGCHGVGARVSMARQRRGQNATAMMRLALRTSSYLYIPPCQWCPL